MTVEVNIYTIDIIYSAVVVDNIVFHMWLMFHDFLATTRLCSDCGR